MIRRGYRINLRIDNEPSVRGQGGYGVNPRIDNERRIRRQEGYSINLRRDNDPKIRRSGYKEETRGLGSGDIEGTGSTSGKTLGPRARDQDTRKRQQA